MFGSINQGLYQHYYSFISDGVVGDALLKKAYAIDSTTISLFKAILKVQIKETQIYAKIVNEELDKAMDFFYD